MSYPQPNFDLAANGQFRQFRLKTTVESPGDIYEFTQAGMSFALGPDSDFSEVSLWYYDPLAQNESLLNKTVLTPGRYSSDRIQADIAQRYPIAKIGNTSTPGQPGGRGRILCAAANKYDSTFLPWMINAANAGTIQANDVIQYHKPVLDVIGFFGQQPSFVPARADKEINIQQGLFAVYPALAQEWHIIPIFGRKTVSVQCLNGGASPYDLSVYLASLAAGSGSGTALASPKKHVQVLKTTLTIPAAECRSTELDVQDTGMWDLLIIKFSSSTSTDRVCRIRMSDNT